MHDRPCSEAGVSFAVTATIDSGAAGEGVWCPCIGFVLFTIAAYKASGESLGIKVSNAGFLVWEVLLEVWQSFGYNAALAEFGHR
jgi:hypothetical protein